MEQDDRQRLDVPLERDVFLRKLLRELTGTLEEVVGLESAQGYIARVGSVMGEWIDLQYRNALEVPQLDVAQVARVFVELKDRIGGDFYIIDITDEKIVLGNRRCPFGEMVLGRTSLCQMTSNVFGRVAADNLGYARVDLQRTIARGDPECTVTVHLQPDPEAPPSEREYYRVET